MKAARVQTWFFAALSGLAITFWGIVEPSLAWQIWILVPAVALLGVPHGALDLPIAQRLWPLNGLTGLLRFSAAYLGLAALVAGLWWALPGVALAVFLAYSALHFASDWADLSVQWRFGGGLSSIGAPALLHPDAVKTVFAQLAPVEAAMAITPALAIGGLVGLTLIAWAVAARPATRPLIELGLIWATAFALPPLIYFVVYFCGLHSPRHLVSALADLSWDRGALRQGAGVTVITLLGAVIAGLMLSSQVAPGEAVLKTIFIGLAALTVPHMLLVELWTNRRES